MKRSGFCVMGRLIGLVRPLSGYMALAVGAGLAGHLCAALITVFGGLAVVNVLGLPSSLSLPVIFACLGVFAVLRGLLRYGEQACNHFIAFKLLALLRDKVFGALRRLAPAKLDGKDQGSLISVITSDIELLEVFYAHTISPVCIAALFTVCMTIWLGRYHWAAALLALIAYAVVGILIPLVTSKVSADRGLRFRRMSGELAGFVLDSLRGLPEILQFGQGESRTRQIGQMTDALCSEEARIKSISGYSAAVTDGVILLFDIAMLLLSTWLCGFSGGLICTLSLMSSFGPIAAVSALGATLQNTFAAGNRVLDILDESPVAEDICGKPETSFSGAAARHVTFAYGQEPILTDVSLTLPENQIIGIVGKSGSGKSTLLKLFMRFWQTQQGQIQISGRSVEEINTRDLRNMESFMTQQTHLFRDSIRSNLLLADPDATDEELVAACKKASIHDFIMSLPQGYDTPVGELGDTLSGGERQRLGLARAFLHDAPFLLLDEPTSNLDSLNEAVILKALDQERKGKTIVLISHRKSTMGIADRVYSVANGRIS